MKRNIKDQGFWLRVQGLGSGVWGVAEEYDLLDLPPSGLRSFLAKEPKPAILNLKAKTLNPQPQTLDLQL